MESEFMGYTRLLVSLCLLACLFASLLLGSLACLLSLDFLGFPWLSLACGMRASVRP